MDTYKIINPAAPDDEPLLITEAKDAGDAYVTLCKENPYLAALYMHYNIQTVCIKVKGG